MKQRDAKAHIPVKVEFLKPRLLGSRYEGHSIPLEVLKDWAAFEGLVLETARWLYLEQFPNRKRTPRGFSQDFSLHLGRIDEGSAIAVLERPINHVNLFSATEDDWFDVARERILDTIEAASTGLKVDDLLPKSLLAYFDQFGRSLREDESVEFTRHLNGTKVIYDHKVRKALVLKASTVYRTEESIRGSMSELNLENRTFTLKLINGEKVTGHFREELRHAAHDALGAYGESLVMVEGAVVRDQNDNRKRVEQVTRIEPLEPLDVPARLEAIALLKDGWLDGIGTKPPAAELGWFSKVWNEHWPDDVQLPHIYPTPSGGLQLEWSAPKASITWEIQLVSHTGELLVSRTEDGELLEELAVNLDAADVWYLISASVKKYQST